MPLALLALTIGAFAIGTTEFVIVGLVPTIAEQLAISLPSAGLLVSIYALGVAIGAPVLTALTGRMPRKQLLLALMALFTAGNLLAWQAPGYETLILVPNNIPGRVSAGLRAQLQVLTHPCLLIIYAITALGYGGVFTAFTFLAPMMQDLAGFSPAAVSWILLGYGVSVAVGNVWGGKLADKHGAVPALKLIFAALVALLLIFQFTASIQYAALATVLVMGIFAFGNVPGLQVYVVQKAEQYTPGAIDVASGLNIAAFNIGIALGSVIGGQTVEHYGLDQTPWIGALIVLVALLLVVLSGRLDKPQRCATVLSVEG